MRTTTATQLANIALEHRAVHVSVLVDSTGSGDMIDLSDYEGRDWIKQVDYSESMDDIGMQATITLTREEQLLSMAPMMETSKLNMLSGSYVPLITVNRDIQIWVAITPPDVQPISTDWLWVFAGSIDEVDWGGNKSDIKLKCRDQAGYLQDIWVEAAFPYGGDYLLNVINDILIDWDASGTVCTAPGGDPTWVLGSYSQEKNSVLEAIKALVAQIGWDVRFRYDDGTSLWVLALEEPDRDLAVADYTFNPWQYYSINQLKISRIGVRNRIRVIVTVAGVQTEVVSEDATSQSKYGDRYMEMAEASSSQLDSTAEATALADAILADLKDPYLDQSVDMPYFPLVELGRDLYAFAPNGKHFSTEQKLAPVSYSHSISKEKATTAMNLKGKPIGGFVRWLRNEGRPGVAKVVAFDRFSAYQNTSQTIPATPTALELEFDVESFDYGSNFVDPEFTAPADGDYGFAGMLTVDIGSFGAGDICYLAILKNGAAIKTEHIHGETDFIVRARILNVALLTGDVITMACYTNKAGTLDTVDGPGATWFFGAKIA